VEEVLGAPQSLPQRLGIATPAVPAPDQLVNDAIVDAICLELVTLCGHINQWAHS